VSRGLKSSKVVPGWELQDQAGGGGWSVTVNAWCDGEKAQKESRKKAM